VVVVSSGVSEVRSGGCERARRWAALAPDGELSEIERRLLDAHLGRCPACATFARTVGLATAEIRAAPLELASDGAWRAPCRRRRLEPALRLATRAAAVATAAAAGAAFFSLGAERVGDRSPRPLAPIVVDATSVNDSTVELQTLREARRAQLLSTVDELTVPAEHTGPNPL
jgi:anti-sigma factor RsiW